MEWMNRGARQNQQASQPGVGGPASMTQHPGHGTNGKTAKQGKGPKGIRIAYTVLLFGVTAILIGLLAMFIFGSSDSSEGKYVDENRLQAVFLNGGQVYFGKIRTLNDKYMRLSDIYYLRVNQQVQPNQAQSQTQTQSNDISLVKLGCELHGPEDAMIINREQVVFWENLKPKEGDKFSQVAKAVDDYIKANPQGQKCTGNTGSTNQQSTTPPAAPATTDKKQP